MAYSQTQCEDELLRMLKETGGIAEESLDALSPATTQSTPKLLVTLSSPTAGSQCESQWSTSEYTVFDNSQWYLQSPNRLNFQMSSPRVSEQKSTFSISPSILRVCK